MVGESFQSCKHSSPNLFLAVCLCIWVGVRYWFVCFGNDTRLGFGFGFTVVISITRINLFGGGGLGIRFFDIILGGISRLYHTCSILSIGNWLSRMNYGMMGAFEYQHA
jgi:hypothetical protein